MMSSTFLNSGVASRILSTEWTTKRLISRTISHIENTPFVFLIKPSAPLDATISSFSRFNGHIIPRVKLLGKGRIVFDLSTPPSSWRNPNLGTRFFWVGVSCHTLASHALECCIMFTLSSETWNGDLWNPQNHFWNDPNKNFSKRVQENAHVALWKYWTEIKIKPIFLRAHRYLFWAFGINA